MLMERKKFTTQQAAKLIGVSLSTMYRWQKLFNIGYQDGRFTYLQRDIDWLTRFRKGEVPIIPAWGTILCYKGGRMTTMYVNVMEERKAALRAEDAQRGTPQSTN